MSMEKANFDPTYLERRMARIETKIRLLIATLIDKKVIGEDFGKTLVSETAPDKKFKWLLREK